MPQIFEAFESVDGKTLSYTKGGRQLASSLWQVERQRGLPLNRSATCDRASFKTASTSPCSKNPVLLLDPPTGKTRRIATVKGLIIRDTPNFTTSADGRTLLYSVLEVFTSQIRMLESL